MGRGRGAQKRLGQRQRGWMRGAKTRQTGVGIFFCVLWREAQRRTWRAREEAVGVSGGGVHENQVAYKERTVSGAMSGCVTSARGPLISESPGLSMAFNN